MSKTFVSLLSGPASYLSRREFVDDEKSETFLCTDRARNVFHKAWPNICSMNLESQEWNVIKFDLW